MFNDPPIITLTVLVLVQPKVLVPISVYVVFTGGDVVITDVVAPVLHVPPTFPDKVTEPPLQNVVAPPAEIVEATRLEAEAHFGPPRPPIVTNKKLKVYRKRSGDESPEYPVQVLGIPYPPS